MCQSSTIKGFDSNCLKTHLSDKRSAGRASIPTGWNESIPAPPNVTPLSIIWLLPRHASLQLGQLSDPIIDTGAYPIRLRMSTQWVKKLVAGPLFSSQYMIIQDHKRLFHPSNSINQCFYADDGSVLRNSSQCQDQRYLSFDSPITLGSKETFSSHPFEIGSQLFC